MKRVKAFLVALLLIAPALASFSLQASESVKLQRAPVNEQDLVSLQRGAHTYVNYCLGCHGASYMRYDRLQAFGLTEQQIKANLIFGDAKVGDLMKTSMDQKDAKEWFGAPPPDLTVIARSRASGAGSGADWLYTYLRSFYRDSSRPTGWNNIVFENVGMPHVLWQLSGQHQLRVEQFKTHDEATAAAIRIPTVSRIDKVVDSDKDGKKIGERYFVRSIQAGVPGTLSPLEYDRVVADLVNFLVYMGEPDRKFRVELGIYVLMFLGVLFVLAYALKKEYWKDVH